MKKNLQLKITMLGTEPPIWRRLVVSSETSLKDLRKILQTAMGWTKSHPHLFVHNNTFYSNLGFKDAWDDPRQTDYTGFTAGALLAKKNDSMMYEYDFGNW